MNTNLTFADLLKAEPQLQTLLERAKAIVDDGTKDSFCANSEWHDNIKPILLTLVGYERGFCPRVSKTSPACTVFESWAAMFDGPPRERHLPRYVNGIDMCDCVAYDLAYQKIYDVMSYCRNCNCWQLH